MSLPLKFALRYLRSKKSLSIINSISKVSSVAIGVAVAAMVVLLSVYNGFDSQLHLLYERSDSDLTVVPVKGKTFPTDTFDRDAVSNIEGVEGVSLTLEDNVIAEYGDRQMFATLRGVDSAYTSVVPIESVMSYGRWQLELGDYRKAVVGRALDDIFADGYSVKNTASHGRLRLYAPRRENISPLLPLSAVKSATVLHAGTLSEAATNLTGHIFTSIDFAQSLLGAPERASAAMIAIADGVDLGSAKQRVADVLGSDFKVSTRYEQNATVYRVMRYEKWSIFFILLLVTVIAAVSIIGSLVMLIIEKRNDIATLTAMGAKRKLLCGIFNREGLLIGLTGVVGGILFGLAVCWVQWRFGLIKMPGNTFLIENYPVAVRVGDLAEIAASVMAVTWIITKFTVSKMIPGNIMPNEKRL